MIIEPAQRTLSVQEYYFSRKLKEIDVLNAERDKASLDRIINLGIGSPDGFPPVEAVEALADYARRPDSHGYASYIGLPPSDRHSPTGIENGTASTSIQMAKYSLSWAPRRAYFSSR